MFSFNFSVFDCSSLMGDMRQEPVNMKTEQKENIIRDQENFFFQSPLP